MAEIIQKWWRNEISMQKLRMVSSYLKSVDKDILQDLSNKLWAIQTGCSGDGAGLNGGVITDMFLTKFLTFLPEYSVFHEGESDMKICDVPLSQKKINGKSTIALDWSKNSVPTTRERFSSHIIIFNTKSEQWWKKPIKDDKIKYKVNSYTDMIPAGIYLVDKQFCKKNVVLSSNNKTNSLIESQYLYGMMKRSLDKSMFIELPIPNKKLAFNFIFEEVH